MTLAEAIDLLREAREEFAVLASYVEDPAFNWPSLGLKVTAKRHRKMRDRIDAALATQEPPDSATPVVEWKSVPRSRTREESWDDGVFLLSVRKHRLKTVLPMWEWYAEDHTRTLGSGYCTTLDEAKDAAIRAARGM